MTAVELYRSQVRLTALLCAIKLFQPGLWTEVGRETLREFDICQGRLLAPPQLP